MRRTLNFFGWALLVSVVLGAVLVAVAVATVGAADGVTTIQLDGVPIGLADLDAGHGLLAVGGVALALLVVALVVPLAVLIPLAIAALALVGALLVVAGVLAVLCSPLILAALGVWLIVRLARRNNVKNRPAAGATIAG